MTTTTPTAPVDPGVATTSADSATLRERKKQRTWQQLHDTAMTMVLERGLVSVTVEEICAEADVSARTFFNYFPSKAAAAVGLIPPQVRPEVRERFESGHGRDGLVSDVCRVVAESIDLPSDRSRMKELIELRPELTPTVHAYMSEMREQLISTVAARVGDETAHLAVALVMSAFMVVVHGTSVASRDELADRLVATVSAMVEVAAR